MRDGRANALAFALAIGTLGKFASFPLPDDRFYFVFISGMAIVLAARACDRLAVCAVSRAEEKHERLGEAKPASVLDAAAALAIAAGNLVRDCERCNLANASRHQGGVWG
jgi:hypothetical protein